MRQVDIIGVGITNFGKHLDKSLTELGGKVAIEALKDSGIKPSEINIGFFSNMQAGSLLADFTIGQNVLWEAGVNSVPVFNVENACTSGSSAFNLAWMSVASGAYDTAIVVGAEKLNVPNVGLMVAGRTELDTLEGLVVSDCLCHACESPYENLWHNERATGDGLRQKPPTRRPESTGAIQESHNCGRSTEFAHDSRSLDTLDVLPERRRRSRSGLVRF